MVGVEVGLGGAVVVCALTERTDAPRSKKEERRAMNHRMMVRTRKTDGHLIPVG
jgi:hypothetical protein